MSDDKILSQSDIDALVESVAPPLGGAKERGNAQKVSTPHHHPSTPPPQDIKALSEKITELTDRLNRLEKAVGKLKQPTNGNAALAQFAQNFRCTSCNSQGFLAFFVKCTHCGQVKLWGSWPTTK